MTCSDCRFFRPRADSNAGECTIKLPPPIRPERPPVVAENDTCDLHQPQG